MTKKIFFWIALFVGAQSFLLQVIDKLLAPIIPLAGNSGFAWIAFQGWALYFLSGCNAKGAVKTFCGYVLGILFSMAMIVGAGKLSFLGFFAVPIIALIIVPVMMYFEYAPWFLSSIPAFFIGAGAFFAFITYIPGATFTTTAVTELIYCFLGLASGHITIAFRKWFENRNSKECEIDNKKDNKMRLHA